MENHNINLTLNIWRQENPSTEGRFDEFKVSTSPDASILEMLDELNNNLEAKGERPIAFESDCREGICGTCGVVVNGHPHGPLPKIATCQLHMRTFKNGENLYIEPFRAKAYNIIKDLIVDRSPLDKIIQSGGFISINTGSAPDANIHPISKETATIAIEAAECIGCGACVAACKNASAMLFVSAKVSQFAVLPQGQLERYDRVQAMVNTMDEMGFGSCTNTYACEAECPKGVSITNIARMNRDFLNAKISSHALHF